MSVIKHLLIGCSFLIAAGSAQASVVLGGTRIIYPADQNEVQITLKNRDAQSRYLVQSWVSNPDDSKAPFIITPPIYKLEENRQTLLHVIYTGDKDKLPQDRESLFVANVKSVSAMPEELKDKNTLQFAMKTRIKLFWRPAKLNSSDALTAWEKLTFTRSGQQVKVRNPTAYYISFASLSLGGKNIVALERKDEPEALSMMVAPFSEKTFQIPSGASGAVTWSAVNDYGASTSTRQQAL